MMYRIKHISTYICAIAEANLYAFVLSLVFCKDCCLGKVFSFIHQAHLRTQKAKDDVCVSETSGQELEYSVFSCWCYVNVNGFCFLPSWNASVALAYASVDTFLPVFVPSNSVTVRHVSWMLVEMMFEVYTS